MTIVVVDCEDSFVWNVVHRYAEIGISCVVVPAHDTTVEAIRGRNPSGIVLSPGPRGPAEAGVAVEVVKQLGGRVPILGICLGHQCIAAAFGLPVAPTDAVCHGQASAIAHDGTGVLWGLPSPFDAGRYHALAIGEPPPDHPLVVTARLAADPRIIMGVRHRAHAIFGVQFHPESVLTPRGTEVLARFAERCSGSQLPEPPEPEGAVASWTFSLTAVPALLAVSATLPPAVSTAAPAFSIGPRLSPSLC